MKVYNDVQRAYINGLKRHDVSTLNFVYLSETKGKYFNEHCSIFIENNKIITVICYVNQTIKVFGDVNHLITQ